MAHPRIGGEGSLCLDMGRLSRWILAICLLAEVGFLLLDYHVNYGGLEQPGPLRRLANIAREDGLASWFAAAQTLLLALTALMVYRVSAHREPGRWHSRGWLLLGLTFLYLAIDDGAQLHERIASTVDASTQEAPPAWLALFPSYTWQVLFMPLFSVLGLFMLVFLWRQLDDSLGRALLLTAMAALAAAIALDFFEGLETAHPLNLYAWLEGKLEIDAWTLERFDEAAYDALRHFGKALEEFLEMVGITLLWFVSLRHLSRTSEGLLFQVIARD